MKKKSDCQKILIALREVAATLISSSGNPAAKQIQIQMKTKISATIKESIYTAAAALVGIVALFAFISPALILISAVSAAADLEAHAATVASAVQAVLSVL